MLILANEQALDYDVAAARNVVSRPQCALILRPPLGHDTFSRLIAPGERNEEAMARAVFRHLNDPKANQLEQFAPDDITELTLGRDPAASLSFDADKGDLVSRHATFSGVMCSPSSFAWRLEEAGCATSLHGISVGVQLCPEGALGGDPMALNATRERPGAVAATAVGGRATPE